jgi:hypothetical protein
MGDTRLDPLVLTGNERRTLGNWVNRRSIAQGLALPGRIVLAFAEGGSSNLAIAAPPGVHRRTVGKCGPFPARPAGRLARPAAARSPAHLH